MVGRERSAGRDGQSLRTRHFAQAFTALLPVVLLDAPPGFPTMRFYQLWHERAHHSSAHRWLRALVGDAGRALSASTGAAR